MTLRDQIQAEIERRNQWAIEGHRRGDHRFAEEREAEAKTLHWVLALLSEDPTFSVRWEDRGSIDAPAKAEGPTPTQIEAGAKALKTGPFMYQYTLDGCKQAAEAVLRAASEATP